MLRSIRFGELEGDSLGRGSFTKTLEAPQFRQIGIGIATISIRKDLVSVKLLSAILGPEMGAPILWTPGKNAFFLQEKPMSIKFLVLGGGVGFWGGGGGVPILFLWARGFF